MRMVSLGDVMPNRVPSVNPEKYPDEVFELWSIPSFDIGKPEITEGVNIGSSKKNVEPNDVLLSRIVPHIRRTWVVKENEDGLRQLASGEWIIFRGDSFYPDYLRYALISDSFHAQFMQTVAGVGGSLLRARPEGVKRIKIPLPPIAEQRRIAAILDKADAIRRKRKQAIQYTEELLRATFLDMFGDPVTNPKGWKTRQLEEITAKITDGEHLNPQFLNEGIPMVMANNVRPEGVVFDDVEYISPADYAKFSRKCNPQKSDLLIVSRGATIGRSCLVDTDMKFCLMGSVILIKPNRGQVCPEFIGEYFSLKPVLDILTKTSGSSAQQAIYLKDIKAIDLPIPSMNLQQEFSLIYQKMFRDRGKHFQSLFHAENLFNSLLQRAFRGELSA